MKQMYINAYDKMLCNARGMYHTSRGVPLKVSQRCILSVLTKISLGQLPRLVRHELMPCLRRGAPVVIKIFKKLCTLKHFMAVAACLLRPTVCIGVASSRLSCTYLAQRPSPVSLSLFLSRSKSRQPDRAGEQHPLVL